MKLEDWEELMPKNSNVIRNLHIIGDTPAHWWVLNIVDWFGPQTSSLKLMQTYAEYKELMFKEEGDTSHVCQIYDQYSAKKDKDSFKDNNYVLC